MTLKLVKASPKYCRQITEMLCEWYATGENIIPYSIRRIDYHDFEYYCADILRRRGFRKVVVTQGSGDYGIDIIAWKDNVKYGIQCKRYSGNVGYRAVEEVYTGAGIYNCNRAVVMTNSGFTKQAKQGARRLEVELWGSEMFG